MTKLTVPELERPRAVAAATYLFEGPQGPISLADLFDGRPRLAVHHTMPDHSGPFDVAPAADIAAALHDPGLRLVLVSRAPYAKLEQYLRHFGRDLPTYSATGAFTTDFPASRRVSEAAGGVFWDDDEAGLSFFGQERGSVLHTGSVAVSRLDFLGLLGVPDRLRPATGRR
ncbi:Uncharacterised protein [Amycolatopsis camponoti]|uniref:Uncharacterized protein n=1 Tax=Amycolatopsis camponoti TaxID=2606593 RepID=A0A6I8LZ38_9PSEU|nr:DUF899 family protein [Amycolatopsis camponoti]VVJ20369.1 Uncharacterised protein [Amycolatopsis camponoti]